MQHLSQQKGWPAQETRGQPIKAQGQEVTPIGRLRQITWPGGGLVWHRPVAVEMRQGEQIRRLPIINVTRRASVALAGMAVLATLALFWTLRRQMQRRSKKR